MYMRIRKAREEQGYTREQFAEKLEVSVSYLAEVERGKTGISVKLLVRICNLLGHSADYILFGENRNVDDKLLSRINRVDEKYMPLLNQLITSLLELNS